MRYKIYDNLIDWVMIFNLIPPHRHQFLSVQHDVVAVIVLTREVHGPLRHVALHGAGPVSLPVAIATRSPQSRVHLLGRDVR